MKKADALKWLGDLTTDMPVAAAKTLVPGDTQYTRNDEVEAALLAWHAEASQALEACLPVGSTIRSDWKAASTWQVSTSGWAPHPIGDVRHRLKAVLEAAHKLIANDRLTSFEHEIQANTVFEVLDQARYLRDNGYLVAATVLAGGALETHLGHLCARHGITPAAHGSIDKYRTAIDQARKSGFDIVSLTDTKQVNGWGGRRNDAAHSPTTYSATDAEVTVMIDGIASFISKYP